MGWLKPLAGGLAAPQRPRPIDQASNKIADGAIHIEHATEPEKYPRQPCTVPNEDLPKIPAEVVRAYKQDREKIWIVIDKIVYDCTEFVLEHPGGNTVIESFQGEDCSWQFWRFHHVSHLREFGQPLRVGCTEGVLNRFKERPRFVGIRRLGVEDD